MDEAAGHAVVVGTSMRALPDRPDGTLDLAVVAELFRDPSDPHEPISGLVAIENTHAHSMGQPLGVAYTQAVADVAHAHGVPLHVDGARFFNAVVAEGVTPAALAGPADSVTFCLSKGLACPVGSVLVGSRAYIWRARRARKLLGGGMRQVGVLAAPGLLALSDGPDGMIARLAEDHANARRLAEGLADLSGIESPGGAAQPAPGRLDPARARDQLRGLPGRPGPGRLPRRAPGPGRADGSLSARDDPGSDPLRDHGSRCRRDARGGTRRPGRDRRGRPGPGAGRRLSRTGVLIIPSIDLAGGRSRVVHWPGAAAGAGAPSDRPR